MIKVLQVYPKFNNAGTEKVIMNLYENMNHSLVQFDFLAQSPGELDDKLRSMGGKIYYIKNTNKREYYKKLVEFFKSHPEYKIVHIHTDGAMSLVIKAAKVSGVPCRIAHSHNARNDLPRLAWFIKGLASVAMEHCATDFCACSGNAAKWLFPHKQELTNIVYNGIRVEKFLYSEESRKACRKELGIGEDTPVFIHVGRFAKQKNHEFLLEIIKETNVKTSGKARWILIGTGPLFDEIQAKAREIGIADKIFFLGNRTDVEKWLSAADVFVFPSLHEGLGIVAIEAQASGLPCVVSEAVPKEAELGLGLLEFISLKQSAAEWAGAALTAYQSKKNRAQYKTNIIESKYNIKNSAKKMQEFYLGKYKNLRNSLNDKVGEL